MNFFYLTTAFFIFFNSLIADDYRYREITKPIIKLPANIRILQYSPPRTGSTLVFNILQYLFEDIGGYHSLSSRRVIKCHSLEEPLEKLANKNYNLIIVGTIRNPLHTLASRLRISEKIVTQDTLDNAISEMIGNYQDCYNTFYRSNYRRTLLLRYEEIYENFDFLLSQIEDLFLLEIEPEQKELIKKYFCKEAMLAETYQHKNFNQYDPITGIHGNHISDYYWLKIIPKIYIPHVLNRLQPTMEKWNYPIDSQKYNNQILRKRSSSENAQSGL